MVAAPVANYGVNAFVNCTGPGVCSVWLYKHAAGSGGGSTGGGTGGGSTGGGTGGGSTGGTDFATLCADGNVIYCQDFNTLPTYSTNAIEGIFVNGVATGCGDVNLPRVCPEIENGSLKFTIPSQSGAGASGQYYVNFAAIGGSSIMPGDTVFVRWKQKFSASFLSTYYSGGGGWKQGMLGDPTEASCATNELVVQNTLQRGFPQMYHACGLYQPFEEGDPFKTGQVWEIDYQPGGDIDNTCLRSYFNSTGTFPPHPDCYRYFPDEWMRFQIGLDYAPSGNSRIRLWVARENDTAWTLVIDYSRDLVDTANGYGKMWFMPYHTGKDPSQVHPDAYTWYDELIISRSFITD